LPTLPGTQYFKETLKGKLNDSGLTIIDVRTESAWEKYESEIRGARGENPEKGSMWIRKGSRLNFRRKRNPKEN